MGESPGQRLYSTPGMEQALQGGIDVRACMEWFLYFLGRAVAGDREVLAVIVSTARFWEVATSDQQRRVLNRRLDDFAGKLTTSQLAVLGNCTQDTAYRDILQAVETVVLARSTEGGGGLASTGSFRFFRLTPRTDHCLTF